MPQPIWTYLTALRYCTEVSTCLAMADILETAAHDRLTRRLKGRWSGHTRLDVARRTWFTLMGGEVILDDTSGEKPYVALLEAAAGVWATTQNQVVCGSPVVLLGWPTGPVRLPLACRIWPKGGPATCAVALEGRRYARQRLRVQPRGVVFAAWSPSQAVLKRLCDSGWYGGCQVQKKRRFAGQPWRDSKRQP